MAISAQELFDWVEWEGGYYSMVRHGLNVEEIEDDGLRAAWRALESCCAALQGAIEGVEHRMRELGVEV